MPSIQETDHTCSAAPGASIGWDKNKKTPAENKKYTNYGSRTRNSMVGVTLFLWIIRADQKVETNHPFHCRNSRQKTPEVWRQTPVFWEAPGTNRPPYTTWQSTLSIFLYCTIQPSNKKTQIH